MPSEPINLDDVRKARRIRIIDAVSESMGLTSREIAKKTGIPFGIVRAECSQMFKDGLLCKPWESTYRVSRSVVRRINAGLGRNFDGT